MLSNPNNPDMRICLVSQAYPPETAAGGIGTQTWNKAHALTRLGHQVEVLSCAGRATDRPLRTSTESGITVHRLKFPRDREDSAVTLYDQSAYVMGYSWSVLESLDSLLRTRGFDLINFPEYCGEGFAFQVNRTIHNWSPVIVQLHAPLGMLAERMGWPDKSSQFYRTGTYLEAESIRLADGWMASSANIADFSADSYGIPLEEIHVVHCGVDCDVFRPLDERTSRRPTVLFVGNIAVSKGIRTALDAVLQLRERYPDILLQVVGKGDDLWKRLASRAAAAGAQRNVERIPFVRDRKTIVKLFQRADVFASPADNENGVANVYVEAMACGCPVVASTTGGAPEAVAHEKTGLLVPPRDPEATTHAIARLLADNELHRRLSAASRQRALGYFSLDKYIERVLRAYRRALVRSEEQRKQKAGENGG